MGGEKSFSPIFRKINPILCVVNSILFICIIYINRGTWLRHCLHIWKIRFVRLVLFFWSEKNKFGSLCRKSIILTNNFCKTLQNTHLREFDTKREQQNQSTSGKHHCGIVFCKRKVSLEMRLEIWTQIVGHIFVAGYKKVSKNSTNF